MLSETLGNDGIRSGREIFFQYLKAAAEPVSGPDVEGKSIPSGFQQPHHSAAKLAARLAAKPWDDLVKDGGSGGLSFIKQHLVLVSWAGVGQFQTSSPRELS